MKAMTHDQKQNICFCNVHYEYVLSLASLYHSMDCAGTLEHQDHPGNTWEHYNTLAFYPVMEKFTATLSLQLFVLEDW